MNNLPGTFNAFRSASLAARPPSAVLSHLVLRGRQGSLFQLRSLETLKSTSTHLEASQEGCPITGHTKTAKYPVLTNVPSLPFLGTLFSQYSGTPKLDINDAYSYHAEYRKRFGDFYTCGLPGFGTGLHGTIHVTTDPNEIAKVVRSEGAYPSGVLENFWYIRKFLKETGSALVDGNDYGLFGNGERWKRHRTFMQAGMLEPKAAKRFIPGINEAARLASKTAPAKRSELNEFLNYCAFDMFNTFMFGELTRCADPSAASDENIQFCQAALKSADIAGHINFSPYEKLMGTLLGIDTKKYKEYKEALNIVNEIGTRKVLKFIERYNSGVLNDFEKASYLAGAITRQAKKDSEVTREEMIALCVISLLVSVDTTSIVTAWNLVHLAIRQDVQEKVFAELSANQRNGVAIEKIAERSSFPYLHACVREVHRITPPFPLPLLKRNLHSDVVVNGITFQKGTTFALNNITNDKLSFADADEFKPERWFTESVENRKGTSEEVLDNPLFRDPFGQGARRCPGSRVASNEVLCMISQLVSNYKIVAKESSLNEIKHEMRLFVQPVIPELEFIPR